MTDTLIVGEVLKPQGIRGELKVKPFTDDAEDFHAFSRVFLDGTEYKVISVRTGTGTVFLGLKGVADRNAAELLRGKRIAIPRSEAPAPEEGRYYIADLLGCRIVTEEGTVLGTLTDVRQAATDIYTLNDGDREVLFPVADGVVTAVDVASGTITVDKKRFFEVAVL